MEIILKQDVKNLGFKDDIVKVKDGYAANYLIPQGMAIMATPTAKKIHAENLRHQGTAAAQTDRSHAEQYKRGMPAVGNGTGFHYI